MLRERIRALMKRKEEQGEGALSQGEQEELRTHGPGMRDIAAGAQGGVGGDREVKGNRRLDDGGEGVSMAEGTRRDMPEQEGHREQSTAPEWQAVSTPGPSTPPARKSSIFGPTQYRVVPPPRAHKQNGLPPRLLNHAE